MEWHQIPGNHVFDVFDTIPLILLQSLTQAHSPQFKVPPTSCGTHVHTYCISGGWWEELQEVGLILMAGIS
jgi:hypothetical protein